jgi:hypothetical protein
MGTKSSEEHTAHAFSLLKLEAGGVNKLLILIVKLHCIRSQNTSFEGIYGLWKLWLKLFPKTSIFFVLFN